MCIHTHTHSHTGKAYICISTGVSPGLQNGVHFVNKNNTWRFLARQREDSSRPLFALTDISNTGEQYVQRLEDKLGCKEEGHGVE